MYKLVGCDVCLTLLETNDEKVLWLKCHVMNKYFSSCISVLWILNLVFPLTNCGKLVTRTTTRSFHKGKDRFEYTNTASLLGHTVRYHMQFIGEPSRTDAEGVDCCSVMAGAERGRINGQIQELHTVISPQAMSSTSVVQPSPQSLCSALLPHQWNMRYAELAQRPLCCGKTEIQCTPKLHNTHSYRCIDEYSKECELMHAWVFVYILVHRCVILCVHVWVCAYVSPLRSLQRSLTSWLTVMSGWR